MASRAGATMVDRVLRREEPLPPVLLRERSRHPPPRVAGEVTVWFDGSPVRVATGATLLEAATHGGVDLRSYCGGNCSCGTCRVEIRGGARALGRPHPLEVMVLGSEAADRGDRLACQAQVGGDVEVHVPEWF